MEKQVAGLEADVVTEEKAVTALVKAESASNDGASAADAAAGSSATGLASGLTTMIAAAVMAVAF